MQLWNATAAAAEGAPLASELMQAAPVAQPAVPLTHSLMSMSQPGPSNLCRDGRQGGAEAAHASLAVRSTRSRAADFSACTNRHQACPWPHPLLAQAPAAAGPFLLHVPLGAGPEYSCCTAAALALIRENVESEG